MKNLFLITVLPLFFISCKNDLQKLKSERESITTQISKLNEELLKVNEKIAAMEKSDTRETITPYTISAIPFQHKLSIQSNVTTEQDVLIYPEFPGTIIWQVREGQKVQKNQVLANVNDGGLASQLKQAQIQTDLAKTAYERQSRLWNEDKIGSEIQYLQAKTNYEAAVKSVSAIESQLSKTKVRAPFTGTIDNLLIQTGQAVAPGMPLAKIVSLGNLKVTADVSEQYISMIKIGTVVNIEIPALNKIIQGKVARISNSINPSNRTFAVEIPLNNADNLIKTNMSVKLEIIDYQNSNALSIPNKAIHTNSKGEKFVYVLGNINKNNAKALKAIVEVGKSNSEFTEVLNGLKIGDQIIVESSKSVVDNTNVKF